MTQTNDKSFFRIEFNNDRQSKSIKKNSLRTDLDIFFIHLEFDRRSIKTQPKKSDHEFHKNIFVNIVFLLFQFDVYTSILFHFPFHT